MVRNMTETVKPIEGITPTALWNFFLVLLGLCAVVVTVYKVVEIVRKEHERRARQNREPIENLVDQIAEKVEEKLDPRFVEIERKLSADKSRLDNHEIAIQGVNSSVAMIKDGLQVTCAGLTAMLDHELHNGNSDQMEKARDNLQAYLNGLIEKV